MESNYTSAPALEHNHLSICGFSSISSMVLLTMVVVIVGCDGDGDGDGDDGDGGTG